MTPDEFTISEHMLDVGDGHTLYVQDWGNKNAQTPILYLHGGPGSGVKDRHKSGFDPRRQRVIFFDQRGCGKSLPYGTLDHNTTPHLITDINRIADACQVETFILTGGSWGSCLALAYGLAHPERVQAMVLRGIFTGSNQERDWLDQGGFRAHFPDVWEQYLAATPKQHHDNPSGYHYKQAFGTDEAAAKQSVYTYSNLEAALLKLDDRFTPENYEDFDYLGPRIEMHYLKHGCFMPDNYILDNASKLSMPIWLIQGRYDMVCPAVTAYELHKRLSNSELIWTTSGHKNEREGWTVEHTILRHVSGVS